MPERQRRHRNNAVLILGISHSTSGICVLVALTVTIDIFYALDILANGVLSTGRMEIINMFGRKQVAARLELLVAGRGSKTKASRGPSEL
eukprot:5446694-Pyramimonas_sp.AAC.1